MTADWENLLLAYLHDPPDKALDIRGHEGRAAALARIAIGEGVDRDRLHKETRTEDQLGSVAERVPMPSAGEKGGRAVGPEDGLLKCHPLSGATRRIDVSCLSASAPAETVTALVGKLSSAPSRFLALWRLWRDALIHHGEEWARLPADTRQPDHTIWNHMDIVAGLQPALAGNHGAAFLSFHLGPVQAFIAAARTVRDLWTGSYLLSWLTFQAMRPLLTEVGPAAFIFPALCGNPLLDLYLREDAQGLAKLIEEPKRDQLLLPCLPNRFVAVIPWGPNGADACGLAEACEQACHAAWHEIAQKVHNHIADRFRSAPHSAGWDRLWCDQISSCFEVRTSVLPERQCRDDAFARLLDTAFIERIKRVRSLADAIPQADRPGYPQQSAGLWMGQVEILGRLSEVRRAVRHIPAYHPIGEVPPKCSLLGSYEQMGPANLREGPEFWEAIVKTPPPGGSRIGRTERLCAVSLVKRFAWPAFLSPRLGINITDRRFSDTATIAAARWLRETPQLDPGVVWEEEKEWSGQWLHWSKRNQDPDEPTVPEWVWDLIREKKRKQGTPPAYYAVLMIDGDEMAKWLRGEKGPSIQECLHPKLRTYFEGLKAAQEGLNAKRPVGPALHASISEALTNFALYFVPDIVRQHDGELIYAGGDDVLALLPTALALACARKLSDTFRQDWLQDPNQRERLLMGGKATVSAGLAVVHYKEDLRFALNQARKAEKAAKDAGRDALQIVVCRRSGEHSSALCRWEYVETVSKWVEAFQNNASDRWAYHLAAEVETLRGLDRGAMQAEVRRQVNRAEKPTREQMGETRERSAGDILAEQFAEYCRLVMYTQRKPKPAYKFDDARALSQFVTLCQCASFLARGREQ